MGLYPIVLDPDSAPWFCARCRRSWWVAELREHAAYQPTRDDFGFGEGQWAIDRAVETERQEAHARGSSCRPDQLSLLSTQLEWLQAAQSVLDPEFHSQVVREATRKGKAPPPEEGRAPKTRKRKLGAAANVGSPEGSPAADQKEQHNPEGQ
jgi:hypothetical protein